MPFQQWFRRELARKAGEKSTSRAFTLGGLILVTTMLAAGAAVLAVPLDRVRERQLNGAVRVELSAMMSALEEFRARHYRFPDAIEELERVGYERSPSVLLCRFRHVADARRFDDHVEVALRHRGAHTAVVARYPARGAAVELPATSVCGGDEILEEEASE